jgi:hypothetical protein
MIAVATAGGHVVFYNIVVYTEVRTMHVPSASATDQDNFDKDLWIRLFTVIQIRI